VIGSSAVKYEAEAASAELINPEGRVVPMDFNDISLFADSYDIKCGNENGILQCIFVGRYKNYVTVLNAEIAEDALSVLDYEQLIRDIDKRFFTCE
jgi:hypothetical protein